ncbi:polyketide synthase [Tsukamurella sp. 8F]|uniref:beta-ketoacyl [acyl carrier protein] synthase domain-containing protein n=1 Tax=unclassified Tsukamurella TaxID=2633480 RepID=UPI0023B99935|nr:MULTISPECIES: polyketide synthase [unclassified Tsukamurella]MDF0529309.1 polyketide synthase [Tsukamurella sp. 8J]MDF0587184.1 polyketide synthase [Tsukamurella sp. 8F]
MRSDAVVVTGIGVEAPAGVETPQQFWDALESGEELLGPMPRDRGWDLEDLFALHAIPGYQRVPDRGGFLVGAAEFDHRFFGVSPREAVALDPQQRVVTRVAHRALEHAGIAPASLAGSRTGCYLGASAMEYGPRAAEANEFSGHRVAGGALGAVAGRVAHTLGLYGPAFTVDAACASSLTALHVAAQGLRAGDCDLALVGGVCVMGSAAAFYEFSKNNALAVDGRLRAYGAEASGTVWGEGAGVFVVETAEHAARHGRNPLAEVVATRVAHNGGGGPIVVPSAEAQERLIAETVSASGIDPDDIAVVEGHGTGTPLGDPAELAALATTYGRGAHTCWLGSVKSNTGHTQAASGALGLAKTILGARVGIVAPTLHAEAPTERFDWGAGNLRLAAEPRPFREVAGSRFAAVSSFGVAGTNAHALVAMPSMAGPS